MRIVPAPFNPLSTNPYHNTYTNRAYTLKCTMSQKLSANDAGQSETTNTGNANLNALVQGLTNTLNELDEELDSLEGLDEVGTDELVHLFSALNDIANTAEDFRKGDVSDALDERIDVGESHDTGMVKLNRIESHRKFVFDDGKALKTLTTAGVDPTPAVSMNATKTAELLEEAGIEVDGFVGESTFDYFRAYK